MSTIFVQLPNDMFLLIIARFSGPIDISDWYLSEGHRKPHKPISESTEEPVLTKQHTFSARHTTAMESQAPS